MKYLFKPTLEVPEDGEIFHGNGAIGYVKDKTLYVKDSEYSYTYKNGMWYEKGYACGIGRVPILEFEDLRISNQSAFDDIIYVPHEGEEN